jgi:5-methylcytosine-specific restriction endonuclease McrA
MMPRREFPKAVKVAVIKRSTREHVVYCEACGLPAKKWQIDHIVADAIGGEPVISNARLICEACYSVKNPQDTRRAAKTKRVEARYLGATMPKVKIQSRGFAKKERREKLPIPPQRAMFR